MPRSGIARTVRAAIWGDCAFVASWEILLSSALLLHEKKWVSLDQNVLPFRGLSLVVPQSHQAHTGKTLHPCNPAEGTTCLLHSTAATLSCGTRVDSTTRFDSIPLFHKRISKCTLHVVFQAVNQGMTQVVNDSVTSQSVCEPVSE